MEEAEQCDRLVVMAGGRVVAEGTVAEVVGDRQVVEARCDSWQEAFSVLDSEGLIVQVQGDVLRVPASPQHVEEVLTRHHLRADLARVPANLEEAFVSIVSAGAAR
jgi:ABC-2 type transport system ATP-binding protein/ribosome-dependent ATPase